MNIEQKKEIVVTIPRGENTLNSRCGLIHEISRGGSSYRLGGWSVQTDGIIDYSKESLTVSKATFLVKSHVRETATNIILGEVETVTVTPGADWEIVNALINLGPMQEIEEKNYLLALTAKEKAAEYVLNNYRVVAVTKGNARLVKYAPTGEPERLTIAGFGPCCGSLTWKTYGAESKLISLLRRHRGLADLLWEETDEHMTQVASWGSSDDFQLSDGVWYARIYGSCDQLTSLGKDDEVVFSDVEKMIPHFVDLSTKKRQGVSNKQGVGFMWALCEGERAYVHNRQALLPIRRSETKNFIFCLCDDTSQRSYNSTFTVVGVSVKRNEDDILIFNGFDNGKNYQSRDVDGNIETTLLP